MEREHGVAALADRAAIVETVDRLFIYTDRKDWDAVAGVLAERVWFDMTSLAGGQPGVRTAAEIVEGWREGLKDVEALHHQSGNHQVTLRGDEAEVFCYGTASHWRPQETKPLKQFVGSYEFGLERVAGGWRINRFKFVAKFVV